MENLGYKKIQNGGSHIENYEKDNVFIQIDVVAKAVRKVNKSNRSSMFLTFDELVAVYKLLLKGENKNE